MDSSLESEERETSLPPLAVECCRAFCARCGSWLISAGPSPSCMACPASSSPAGTHHLPAATAVPAHQPHGMDCSWQCRVYSRPVSWYASNQQHGSSSGSLWCLLPAGALPAGRLTLLLGPPGCGKSTLMKALSGTIDDDLQVCACTRWGAAWWDERLLQPVVAQPGVLQGVYASGWCCGW